MSCADNGTSSNVALRRVLTLGPLIFYGLSVIVGAGIYVAISSVLARAGEAAPLSFLFAGIAAILTGLCYAELASRYPEAAGAAAYVKHAFGSDRFAQLTGAALALAVGISTASIAAGAARYVSLLIDLPDITIIALLIALSTGIAMMGVRESAGLAAVMGGIEIAGVLVAIVVGLLVAPDFDVRGVIPHTLADWSGVAAGAFIAFFAFIGFETLANMAEEVKSPRRTIPRGIIGAVGASIALYVAVALVVVLAHRGTANPLVDLFEGPHALVFAAVGSMSVANGILVQIIMLARLFYGMARNHQLPRVFGSVNRRLRTPVPATVAAGTIVLAVAILMPFERLLILANGLTLLVFAVVDVALWRVQRTAPAAGAFAVPRLLPPIAAATSIGLLLAEALT